MIVPMILWSVLALIGCAAFATLGIWAHHKDEAFRAQRAWAAQAVVDLAQQDRGLADELATPSAEEIDLVVVEQGRAVRPTAKGGELVGPGVTPTR